jgi:hypothetical protein
MRRPLIRFVVLALAVVVVVEAYAYARYRYGRYIASVKVRWTPETTDAARTTIERELALVAAEQDEGRSWTYRIADYGAQHIERIVTHTAIEDTGYVERTTFVAERLIADPLPVPLVLRTVSGGAAAAAILAGLALLASFVPRVRVPPLAPAARGFLRCSRPAQAGLLFGAGFLPLAVGSAVADARHPAWRVETVYRAGLPMPAADEFLSQDPELLDHDVYFHGLYGWVERARQADVIFTGNSRAVYAFRDVALEPHFARLGLTYYSLAFAGGADAFPLALMRKHDIRPKVLVVNVHGFFANDLTRFGQWAMARDWFTGWNFVAERQASWVARYRLHQVLPHWPTEFVHRGGIPVIYRSVTNGSWRWRKAGYDGRTMGTFPVPRNPADPAENEAIDRWTQIQLAHAPAFIREMESRGTQVVLAYVPWNDAPGFYSAENLARSLGRQLVVAWPDGLTAASGSHISEDGARRYIDALVPKLVETPEFRAAFGARAPSQTRID